MTDVSDNGAGLESRRERTARRSAWLVTAVGVAVTAVGLAQPVSFGWFGWLPDDQQVIVTTPTVVLLHPVAAIGLVISITAGLAAAFFQGRLHGRRRRWCSL